MKFYCSFPGSKEVFSFINDEEYGSEALILAPFRGKSLQYAGSLKKLHGFNQTIKNEVVTSSAKLVSEGWKSYENCLNRAIKKCQSGEFEKIVVARLIKLHGKINSRLLFIQLLNQHKNAFVYWFQDMNVTLLGASPELLLKQTNDVINTSSLAGTMLNPLGKSLSDWGTKERKEQNLVTEFIVENLEPFCNNITRGSLEVKSNGQLNHLHTPIKARMKPSESIDSVLEKLHPTPAVCGIPREEALNWILENEGFSRNFYSGYLGLKSRNASNYFVNLRCIQIKGEDISIYVGGGITAESDCEKEKLETINKSRIILDAIEKTHRLENNK